MSNRVYASLLYIALILGSSWVAVTVGEALTREALTRLALIPASEPRPSRVETFLATQDRMTPPEAATTSPLVPAAPSLAIGTLAKAMDDAEQPSLEATSFTVSADAPAVASAPEAAKPRVAGWVKRLPKGATSLERREETSGRLIMRSLRAEM